MTQPGHVYIHPGAEDDYRVVAQRLQTELVVVVADHREVLLANLGNDSWAVRTCDRALVLVAEEYIGHDMVLSALGERFGHEAVSEVWRSRHDLRELVLDQERARILETQTRYD